MKRLLIHIRRNAVAYVALFVALGGTSYAAFELPNHSIDPVKFDPKFINGSVRAWAIVGASGRLIASGGKAHAGAPPIPGSYEVSWGVKFGSNCATTATVDGNHSPTTEHIPIPGNPSVPFTAGYAVADSVRGSSGRGVTFVTTFNQQGQLTPLGFDVSVTC
jgi:hypothetical protein